MWGRWKASFKTSYLILNLEKKKSNQPWYGHLSFRHVRIGSVVFLASFFYTNMPVVSHSLHFGTGGGTDGCSSLNCAVIKDRSLSVVMKRAATCWEMVASQGPNCPLTCGAAWEEVGMLSQAWGGYPDFRVSLIWVEAKCWTYVQFSAYSKRDDSLAQK